MPREERDYLHRSLVDKLGVEPDQRVCMRGAFDDAFVRMLSAALGAPPARRAQGKFDAIFLYVRELEDLRAVETLAAHLVPTKRTRAGSRS